jgi:transposase-like protein
LEAGEKRLAGDTTRQACSGEVKELHSDRRDLEEAFAEQMPENGLRKKRDREWGRRRMRYSASEKPEIIRLVEQSHLPVRRTLDERGIPATTFYRWYDRSTGPSAEPASRTAPAVLVGCGSGSRMTSAARSRTWP